MGAEKFDAAFKFAVFREPVDRLFSAFRYLRAGGGSRYDELFGRRLQAFDFESFVMEWLSQEGTSGDGLNP
jgi:hypothetical protein